MTPIALGPMPPRPDSDAKLRAVSQQLEAAFLAEMLKHSGLNQMPDAFSGGTGEDQFGSFLVQAQAEKMVQAGGIGLAEQIFESLKGRENADI